MRIQPESLEQTREENRAKRRNKKKNPKMKMSGKGMKRFAKPKK